MNPVRGGDHGDYMLNSMKNDNHKLKNIENRDFIRSRSTSNGVNKTQNIKVEGKGNGINFKFPVLKQYDPGSVILKESATEESLRSFASLRMTDSSLIIYSKLEI